MHVRPSYAAATLVALIGCAPHSRPAGPTAATPALPPPPAATPVPAGRTSDAVRLGPSALRYAVHRRIYVQQEIQGRTATVDRGVRGYVSATITGPADGVGYPLVLTIDSLVLDSGTVLPPVINLAAARGLRYTGRLAPTGEMRSVVPSDSSHAWIVTQVFGSFQGFYPRLPAAGLPLGAEWTDTVTTTDRTVVEVTTTSVNHSRAVAWEEWSGTRCLRLEVTSAYRLAGAGEQGGQPRQVSGSGTRSTLQFVAADGRYLGGEMRDSVTITITFPAEGATVPVRQVSRYTVAVLP